MRREQIVAAYFNAQITALEEEVRFLQSRVRYRRIDVNDTYEMQNALIRLEQMKQTCRDISVFLKIEDNVITNEAFEK